MPTPTISLKYPSNREELYKSPAKWLVGKQLNDNAEGLWRIHDALYDLTDFIKDHPGGRDWIDLTRGTDITEAFETHHMSHLPETLKVKYKIRDASMPRNYKLTFDENGFYKTLKRRIITELGKLNQSDLQKITNFYIDMLLITTIVSCLMSAILVSYSIAIVAGIIQTLTVVAAHNYLHQRDNWRMRIFNLTFMNHKDWRITHALSHHMYPNSYSDFEVLAVEPALCFMPDSRIKGNFQRYGSWIYGPLLLFFIFHLQIFRKHIHLLFMFENIFVIDDLISYVIPVCMLCFGSSTKLEIIKIWNCLLFVSSFTFGVIGYIGGHYHPEAYFEGDAISYVKSLDFGVFQLNSLKERSELKNSLFLSLISFGDHGLHHLFPTIDQAVLPFLEPIVLEVCDQFNVDLRSSPLSDHLNGIFARLALVGPRSKIQ